MNRFCLNLYLVALMVLVGQQAYAKDFYIVKSEGSPDSIQIGSQFYKTKSTFDSRDIIHWSNATQSIFVKSDSWKGVISSSRFSQTKSRTLEHHIAELNKVKPIKSKSGSFLGNGYVFEPRLSTAEGYQHKRLALIIGNENYKDEGDRLNVLLFGLCDSLRACGFDVVYLMDCNEETINKSIEYVDKELKRRSNQYEAFVFYYEGHGLINKQKQDCIIPIEERANNYGSKNLLSLSTLANHIKSDIPKFFIINACRESKSLDGGVMSPEGNNTCFFFSTSPGKPAKAGANGRNSKFTELFASAIMKGDVPFVDIIDHIQEKMSEIEQHPVLYGCLPIHNRFIFHPREIDDSRVNYIIGIANNLYQNAKSKYVVNAKSEAMALCLQARDSLQSIRRNVGLTNDFVNANYKLLKDSLDLLMSRCNDKNSLEKSNDKISSLLKIAENAEKAGDMGVALRNYYGAMLKIRSMNLSSRDTSLCNKVSNHLDEIASKTTVRYEKDEYDETQVKLRFYWPDGRIATNVPYKIENLVDEGQTSSSVDGNGYVTLPIGRSMEEYSVDVDISDVASWGDAEMRSMVSKNPSNVQMRCKPSAQEKVSVNGSISLDTIIRSFAGRDKIQDAKYYDDAVVKVCKGISMDDEESVRHYFTENGYDLLQKLMAKKRIVINDAKHYELVSYYGEIYVRSISMTMHFAKGKEIIEDVVFVFNSDKKIDGIQYALDKVTSEQIRNMDLADTLKYAVINLIENYRTAYSLQNKQYLESVFSDDAVIIVGRVVNKAMIQDSRDNFQIQDVEYLNLNKEEYLKRLERQFKSKEWIDLKFSSPSIVTADNPNVKDNTGIGLWQEYSSSNYCDKGYLFLIVGWKDNKPVVYLRAWHPQKKFGFKEYEELRRLYNQGK